MTECKVELKIKKGAVSIAQGIRINGFEIPGVTDVNVRYSPLDARRITLDILPSDIIEIDESEW